MVTNSLRLTAKYAKIRNGVDAELVCVSCHCLLTVQAVLKAHFDIPGFKEDVLRETEFKTEDSEKAKNA